MRGIFLVVVLFLASAADVPMPKLSLDLDLPPEQRWKGPMMKMIERVGFDHSFSPVFKDVDQVFLLGGCDTQCIKFLAHTFAVRFPSQNRELIGIWEAFVEYGHKVDIEFLAAMQYFYEIGHARPPIDVVGETIGGLHGCTSVVACRKDGNVFHGRNLDFHCPEYRNITAQVVWRKGGADLFESTQFMGEDVGIATAVSKGKFSFSYNWRATKNPIKDVLDCIANPKSAAPFGSFVRELFENGVPFSEAADAIENAPMCGPAYAIVAGTTDAAGAVFTKNYTSSLHPLWIEGCALGQRWFVAQANYDHWNPQPPNDDRLGLATRALLETGQARAATIDGIWAVLSTPGNETTRGVLNRDTLYTAAMNPQSGDLVDAIREKEGAELP